MSDADRISALLCAEITHRLPPYRTPSPKHWSTSYKTSINAARCSHFALIHTTILNMTQKPYCATAGVEITPPYFSRMLPPGIFVCRVSSHPQQRARRCLRKLVVPASIPALLQTALKKRLPLRAHPVAKQTSRKNVHRSASTYQPTVGLFAEKRMDALRSCSYKIKRRWQCWMRARRSRCVRVVMIASEQCALRGCR